MKTKTTAAILALIAAGSIALAGCGNQTTENDVQSVVSDGAAKATSVAKDVATDATSVANDAAGAAQGAVEGVKDGVTGN